MGWTWAGFSHPQVNLALFQPSALCYLPYERRKDGRRQRERETIIKMEKKRIILSKWRQLVKEESADIFTWEPSIVSLKQKPHIKNQNKSMQGVEMNPNSYCLSCWRFMGLGDIQ